MGELREKDLDYVFQELDFRVENNNDNSFDTMLTLLVFALRKIPIADHEKMKEYILHHMRPNDKHNGLQTCSLC